jgi:hypothetical protein
VAWDKVPQVNRASMVTANSLLMTALVGEGLEVLCENSILLVAIPYK